MATEPLLSICLPIYNQADTFREQVRSVSQVPSSLKQRVEFVIVDDCSTDNLSQPIEELRASGYAVQSFRNARNLGRAASVARSIRCATGRYVLIMDGDDPFIERGLGAICETLFDLEATADPSCLGAVFGTVIDDGRTVRRNVLSEDLRCTLLALRADHGIVGDLKEVIRRGAVLSALCPLFETHRRVPTSLLWMRISTLGYVKCSSRVVVRKSYREGGITRNLKSYRDANLAPLLALYRGIADSPSYKSRLYRLRAATNYHRFLARSPLSRAHIRSDFCGIAALAGISIGLLERRISR